MLDRFIKNNEWGKVLNLQPKIKKNDLIDDKQCLFLSIFYSNKSSDQLYACSLLNKHIKTIE